MGQPFALWTFPAVNVYLACTAPDGPVTNNSDYTHSTQSMSLITMELSGPDTALILLIYFNLFYLF